MRQEQVVGKASYEFASTDADPYGERRGSRYGPTAGLEGYLGAQTLWRFF